MHIARRLGHRAYQRIRAEHLAEEVGAEERHNYLEPCIRRAQQDPHRHAAEIVFLLIVFGPVRRSAVKALRNATFVERIDVQAVDRAGRSAAWMINQMERERLDSAAVEAVLTAIARYPEPRPEKLFPWLKNTIGFRLLDLVRTEIAGNGPPSGALRAEQIAVANTLDDLLELEPPRLASDSAQRRALPVLAMNQRCRGSRGAIPSTGRSERSASERSDASRPGSSK